jgi:hypothetical protein
VSGPALTKVGRQDPLDRLDWMQNELTRTCNPQHPGDLSRIADPSPHAKALRLVAK